MADLAKVKRNVSKMVELGAPESDIDSYILSEGVSLEQLRSFGSQPVDTSRGVVESATRGATIGLSDYIVPALGAGMAKLAGVEDRTLGELFQEAQGGVKQRREQLRQESPVLAYGTEIASSLPTGGALFKGAQAAATASRLGKASTPAALGAVGAAEGAGFSEAQTAEGILQDAVVGGVLAPTTAKVFKVASPALARTVRKFAEGVSNPVQSTLTSVFQVNPVAARNFMREGVKPSVAALTDSPTIARVNSLLKGTFGSTDVIENNIDDTLNSLQRRVTQVSTKSGEVSGQEAGEIIKKGVDNYVNRFQNVSTKLYNRIGGLIDLDSKFTAGKSLSLLADESQKFTQEPNLAARIKSSPAFKLLNDLTEDVADGQIRFGALKAYRTEVGNLIKENAISGADNAMAKRVYAAISEDMRQAAATKGPKALKAFDNANAFYKDGLERIENTLNKYRGSKADPAAIFRAVQTSSKIGDVKVSAIMKAVPKRDRPLIRDAVLQQMGYNVQGDFSARKFVSDYNKISPEAKNALFGTGESGFRQSLDRIASVSKRIVESGRFENVSRTADNLGNVGLLALGVIDPATGVATGIGANLSARLMTNPSFAKVLAKYSTKPVTKSGFTRMLKEIENVAVSNPQLENDIATYIGLIGAYVGQSIAGE